MMFIYIYYRDIYEYYILIQDQGKTFKEGLYFHSIISERALLYQLYIN